MARQDNWEDNVTITGTDESDELNNWGGSNVTIESRGGDDRIYSSDGNNIVINSGTGNDSVMNWEGTDLTVNVGEGDDTIRNSGTKVSIDGGAGSDSIFNNGSDVLIDGGDDNDTVNNIGNNVTIDGGAGFDSISNNGNNVTIDGGAGSDLIFNNGSDVLIDGGDDNDTVDNRGNDVTIDGGVGFDSISNEGNNVTIDGGAGSDLIFNNGSDVLIDGGDDNDTVDNRGNDVTIDGGAGSDSIVNNGSDVLIDGGNDNDTVNNRGNDVTIDGGAGSDSIVNNGNGDAYIFLGYNSFNEMTAPTDGGKNVVINGGDDDDYIANGSSAIEDSFKYLRAYSNNVTLGGGAGSDTIINCGGSKVSLGGGSGDDSIVNDGGKNVTLNGGAGSDTLTGGYYADTFVYEGGNDVITNYSGEDTVHITSGGIDSYSFNGADLIFHIGDDSLTLKSMKNHAITVKDSSGKTSTKIYGTGYSGAEVMKNFVQSMANSKLDTKQKLDEAVKACSHFNSLQEVIDQLLSDRKKAGDAETFLRDYCGIFLDNADSGAVTGWDAGGLTIKTKDDLLPKNGSASYPTSTTFTKRGLTITVPERSTLNEDEQLVVQKMYSANIEDSLKLIEKTYGVNFTDKPLSIPLSFTYKPGEAVAWAGVAGFTVNMSMGGQDPSYYTPHELTHVAQQNFGFFDGMTDFMIEGMADITADGDMRPVLELANDSTKLSQCLNTTNNTGGDAYTSGVIFWRYLMRQAADNYDGGSSTSTTSGGGSSTSTTTGGGSSTSTTTGGGSSTSTTSGGTILDNLIDRIKNFSDSNKTKTNTYTPETNNTSTNTKTSTTTTTKTTTSTPTYTSTTTTTTTPVPVITQHVYTGGHQIITNYQQEQKIIFGEIYMGSMYDAAGNLFVGSSTGTLIVANAGNKFVDLSDGWGNTFAKTYAATAPAVVDGRGLNGFEMINGSAGADIIQAGDGGSQLWGGTDNVTDALLGGNGADIFIGGRFQGSDNFFNASSADVVNITDATLSDIVAAFEANGVIAIGFNTGNVISVQSSELLSAAFTLADGSAYRYNHVTKSWQGA